MELKHGCKQTDVGVIPSDWDIRSIARIAPLQRGFDLPQSQRKDGPYPVVYSNGIVNFHAKAMVRGPGVVTGRSGTLGRVHYVEDDFWPHNTSLWVTHFNGNNPRFVYYLYQRIGFDRFGSGSGVPTLNRNDAHSFQVAIPFDASEQSAIAAALGDMDALLSAMDTRIAKQDDLKTAVMQSLLTGKIRLPGFGGKWEAKRLGEVLAVRHGKNQKEVEADDGEFPILATGGQIGWATESLYNKPSVLIGRKGTIDRPQYMDTPFWTVDTLFFTEIKDANVAKFFFYRFFLIDWMQYNEASGVPSLNARTIENIEIACPQPEEQAAIVEVLSAIDAQLTALEAQREKTALLKQGMMQELLTGRTRLV